ncbi:type II secretion system protein [Colwellia piezophila]|uniref:type II secretion system protein n=1 Tax=Colwellia piezophila TaxID=211668 RepID=UPI00035D10A2|nr:type II secretion system protein [Colwellia piezophila]
MKNSGFTLIELVVVITILGLLAIVAAPRFIDLSGDAKGSVIQNISGNLTTAINFALLKDQIAGGTGEPIDYNGNTITFIAGNPQPDATQMRYLLEMDLPATTFTSNWSTIACKNSEFCLVGNRPFSDNSLPPIDDFNTGTGVFIWPKGYILGDCFAYYLNLAKDDIEPIVDYVDTGC